DWSSDVCSSDLHRLCSMGRQTFAGPLSKGGGVVPIDVGNREVCGPRSTRAIDPTSRRLAVSRLHKFFVFATSDFGLIEEEGFYGHSVRRLFVVIAEVVTHGKFAGCDIDHSCRNSWKPRPACGLFPPGAEHNGERHYHQD